MARESGQKEKERIDLFIEVHIGEAIELKRLADVVGILGSFSGDRLDSFPEFESEERQFVEIGDGNFDTVLKGMAPRLVVPIDEPLSDDSPRSVELLFRDIDDFRPEQIVQNVPYLKELLEERRRLSDLLTIASSNHDFAKCLGQIGTDKEILQQIIHEANNTNTQAETPGEEENHA